MKRMAFTLVELLVVIAIIGLISTTAVVSLNNARSKARDTKRIADMKQIKTAIDIYYEDNGSYPTCGNTLCTTTGAYGDFTTLGIKPTYMGNIPKDPKNIDGQYGYYYAAGYTNSTNCTYSVSSGGYILGTRLENPTGFSSSCGGSTYNGWNNSQLNFITGNL
jgi:prepilin-type N-terminal cleavage/methylation domain-containing protein